MEQNEGLRQVVGNILKKRGYRVLPASAPAEALEIARTHGAPDLLIGEPEVDVAKLLSSRTPPKRALLLNGHSNPQGVPTLTKPFELDALLGKVRELLQV
jgi:hypothetical protein